MPDSGTWFIQRLYHIPVWYGVEERCCQQPYYQSIMNLDDPRDSRLTRRTQTQEPVSTRGSQAARKWAVDSCATCSTVIWPRKQLQRMWAVTLSSSQPHHSFQSRPVITLVLSAEIAFFYLLGSGQLRCGMGEGVLSIQVFSASFLCSG